MTALVITTQFDSGAIEVVRLDDPNDIGLNIRRGVADDPKTVATNHSPTPR